MGRRAGRGLDRRVIAIGLSVIMAWGYIGFRLFSFHNAEAAEYVERGLAQRLRNEPLDPPRGRIFDRDGVELAVTIDATTVYANPQYIDDPLTTARFVSPLVGVDSALLAERFARDKEMVFVARKMDPGDAAQIVAADIPGIFTMKEPKRVYPAGSLAAQVLGFVRVSDNEPLEGLELRYDEILAGIPGEQIVERDPSGAAIPQAELVITPAQPGGDLVLTIDRGIQFAAEEALGRTVEDVGAAAGSVIVLDPETGEILAMANYPTFDPNDVANADPVAFRNRAVTDKFEPGSTLKLITVAAALDEGVIAPNQYFWVPEEIEFPDKVYTDVGTHPEQLSVADIVAYSSNVGTILIQAELGNDLHHRYLQAFGLGQTAGSDFGGENPGLLRPAEEWCEFVCGPSTAIGYRVDVTALQMAAVYGTIANDGVWIQPHIVKEVVDGEGVREPYEAAERPVVSQETAEIMRIFLGGVVNRGTGHRAAVDGYTVGGKTGTTEKWDPEALVYSETARISSFIGMAPLADPQVVVAVVLDSPQGPPPAGEDDLRFGGVSAAPLFAEIATAALHQLGVPPDAP